MSRESCSPRHKLSFTTMATPELDHLGAIALAKEHGFDGIDLRVSDNRGEISPEATTAELARVREDFAAAGLAIPGLLCYRIDLERGGAAMAWELRRHLAIAEEVGSPLIRLFSGNPELLETRAAYIDEYAGVLREVLAEGGNASVVIQNHKGNTTLEETLELIRLTGSDRCGIVYSPDHCSSDADFLGEVRQCLPCMEEIYLADRNTDGKPVLPGEGYIPLGEIVRALVENGYGGFFTFKWERIWHKLPPSDVAFPVFTRLMKDSIGVSQSLQLFD